MRAVAGAFESARVDEGAEVQGGQDGEEQGEEPVREPNCSINGTDVHVSEAEEPFFRKVSYRIPSSSGEVRPSRLVWNWKASISLSTGP